MSNPDQRTAVARAIWAVMREHEDRCDMELEDNGSDEPIWQYADAALAGLSPYEPCYVCGRPMDGLSEDDCHCFHFKQLRSVATTEAAAMAATVPAGFRLVPIVPTEAMIQAGACEDTTTTDSYQGEVEVSIGNGAALRVYSEMLKAAPQAPVAGQPAEPSPADLVPVFLCHSEHNRPRYMRDAVPSDMNEHLRKYSMDAADWLVETGQSRNATMCMRRAFQAIYPTEFFVALAAPKGDSNG